MGDDDGLAVPISANPPAMTGTGAAPVDAQSDCDRRSKLHGPFYLLTCLKRRFNNRMSCRTQAPARKVSRP